MREGFGSEEKELEKYADWNARISVIVLSYIKGVTVNGTRKRKYFKSK